MKKNVLDIINRVMNKKAVGIIYNVPKIESALLQNKLLDDHKHVVIRGRNAYTSSMLKNRLSSQFKIHNVTISMLPTLLDGKMLTITEADLLKTSYDKTLDELYKNKVPVLLLMSHDNGMELLRTMKFYNKVLTIEIDYKLA